MPMATLLFGLLRYGGQGGKAETGGGAMMRKAGVGQIIHWGQALKVMLRLRRRLYGLAFCHVCEWVSGFHASAKLVM